jgi:outer membrane protein
MVNKALLVMALLLAGSFAIAQKSLVLETYVKEGLDNNLSLRQETLEIAKASEAIRQAKALFYPQAVFAPNYSYAAGGRRLNFPVGDLLNPAYKALNDLTGKDQFPTNIENVNVLLAPTNFHDTKVSIQYAIYNPEIKYNYLIQKNLMSAQEAKKKVVENELRYTIETAYFQYLKTLEAVKIYDASRSVLDELLRLNKKLVANQVATADVVFSADYELSKLAQQRSEMHKNNQVAQAYFNFLLNKPLTAEIIVDSLVAATSALDYGALPAVDNLAGRAIDNRQELKQLGANIEAAENAVRLHLTAATRPSFFIGGNVGFQGYGYKFKDQSYAVGQVGLQWNLFKGYERKSKIQQAKIQTDALKTRQTEIEKQIELQTTQALYDLVSSQESLLAADDASRKAAQYFRLIDSKYRNGHVLLIEYIKAQNDVVSAKMQRTITRYDVLIKNAFLDKIIAEP